MRRERYSMIRLATSADAEAVARVYNDAITDGSYATADVEPVSVESRVDWIGLPSWSCAGVYRWRSAHCAASGSLGTLVPSGWRRCYRCCT